MTKNEGSRSRRLNLKLTATVNDRLERLVQQTEAENVTEVIRRALAVYDHLWNAKANNKQIIIRDKNSEADLLLL